MKRTFRAKVDSKGNLKIFNTPEFKGFLSEMMEKDCLLTLEFEDKNQTVFQLAYFKNVVVNRFIKIFSTKYGEHINQKGMIQRLLSWSPFGIDDNGNERDIESLSRLELSQFIEHCKMIASLEFDEVIND